MRISTRLFVGLNLLAALGLAFPVRAQSQSQPAQQPATAQTPDTPAAAATKPKDTTAPAAPKRVYTNDDLRGMGGGGVSVVGNSRTPAKSGLSNSNEPKNEQSWRSRAQKLRNDMAQVDREIAELEAANQKSGNGTNGSNGSNPPPPPTSAYYGGSRVNSQYQNQLRRLNNRKAQIQEQMDQLQEEARRANVPAGWLR